MALLACALLLGACDRAAEVLPGTQKGEEPEVSEAAFQVGEVRVVDPQDRPDSAQKAQAEAPKVAALMNSLYSSAFLDPAKWQGGTHPDLPANFTGEAQAGVGPNLGNLALADLADQLESVQSSKQSVDRITFFVEDDGSLPIGLASVTFEAVGHPKDGDDVAITHAANYWLQREGDTYKISAFDAGISAVEQAE